MSHGTRPKPLRGSDARTKPSASTSSGEVRASLRAEAAGLATAASQT